MRIKIQVLFLVLIQYSFSQTDSLLVKLNTLPNDTSKVNQLNQVGRDFFNKDITRSFSYLNEAIELSKTLEYKVGLSDSYKNMGTAYYYQRQYDSTKLYWKKALKILPNQETGKKADAYNNMGIIFFRLGETDSSLNAHSQSLKLRKMLPDSSSVARSYNNIGALYRAKGNYSTAIEYYFKALPIYKAYDLKKETSDLLNGIGLLYQDIGNFEEALKFLLDSYELRKEIGNPRTIASSMNNIGALYFQTKAYDKAEFFFKEYLSLATKLNDKKNIAGCYINLSNIYKYRKEYDKTIEFTNKANTLFEEMKDVRNSAIACINLGSLYFDLKQYKKSKTYYKQAYEKAAQASALNLQSTASRGLSEALSENNKYKEALYYFREYSEMQDTLFSHDLNEKVARYQELYEAEKKTAEIKELEAEALKKEKEIALSKVFRNWTIVFSGLLIVTLILLFNRFKIKRKALRNEKEKFKLQAELNEKELELKAAELSSVAMNSLQKNKILSAIEKEVATLKADEKQTKETVFKALDNLVKNGLAMDDQWDIFQKHFNNVHPGFFDFLNKNFPELTNNDLKACAYIRMNLSSKEVASLTNVSPKSVTMHRYRLKKKLNLDTEDSLKNFLFNI